MGSRYLTDLAAVLRDAGLIVIEVGSGPGQEGTAWKQRARGSGGYDSGRPNHVMVHHTASGAGSDGWPDVNYCTFGDEDAPLCNLYLARNGIVWACAAGATNTNGSGYDPCGYTPHDSMNSHAIGVEAGNNGTGEPWPQAQQTAYVQMCHALCAHYGIPPSRVHSHFEWAPDRKTDPAGPSAWATSGKWDMGDFREDVDSGVPGPGPGPDPGPGPTPPPSEDWMANLPTIKKGDKGDYVERMQHLLAAAGYMDPANTSNYDGVWGNGTDGAKARFDNEHGLGPSPPTDCGPKSWESLMTGKHW